MIHIRKLKKYYAGRLVLDIDDLVMKPGYRYVLLGANGAGKSTFLRILAGVLQADEGDIDFQPPLSKEDMIYLPQKPYAFSFSVRRNVTIAIKNKLSKNAKDKAADKALSDMGIEHYCDAAGNTLSGGETQRMCLARMIVEPHKLMLLDEPTSATDVAGSELIEQSLQRYLLDTACTLIFSTHQPAQALRFSDRALFFDSGHICEFTQTQEMLHHPQTEAASAFLSHWRI